MSVPAEEWATHMDTKYPNITYDEAMNFYNTGSWSGSHARARTYSHDALVTMNHLGIAPKLWDGLSDKARDTMIKQLKKKPYPKGRAIDFSKSVAIDSRIDGKKAILLGGKVIKEGDRNWSKALMYVGYAFDEETMEETLARSRRNVEGGRKRLDLELRQNNMHAMLDGPKGVLYKMYVGHQDKPRKVSKDARRARSRRRAS